MSDRRNRDNSQIDCKNPIFSVTPAYRLFQFPKGLQKFSFEGPVEEGGGSKGSQLGGGRGSRALRAFHLRHEQSIAAGVLFSIRAAVSQWLPR